jgi:hypothetical protein
MHEIIFSKWSESRGCLCTLPEGSGPNLVQLFLDTGIIKNVLTKMENPVNRGMAGYVYLGDGYVNRKHSNKR